MQLIYALPLKMFHGYATAHHYNNSIDLPVAHFCMHNDVTHKTYV
jgi:hypothetical protein